MDETPAPVAGFGLRVAFAVTVSAGIAPTIVALFRDGAYQQIAWLIALGTLLVVFGWYGDIWCRPAGPRPGLTLYMGGLFLIGNAIVYCWHSHFLILLVLFPMVALGAMSLPGRWPVVYGFLVVIGALFSVGLIRIGNPIDSNVFLFGLSFGAGVLYTILFTQIAVREVAARAEVEQLNKQLETANRQLRTYASQAQEIAVVNERNRLALEIHDSLGHYLTVINVQLEAADKVFERDSNKSRESIRKAQTLAQDGLADIRRSVAALRSAPLDNIPLPDAIEKLVTELDASGVQTVFVQEGDLPKLSLQAELTVYRAAQEALNNVRKHAQAERVDVQLVSNVKKVRLAVTDDGVGGEPTNPSTAARGSGFGLLGVQERVGLLGGKFRVKPGASGGYEFVVEILA